MRVKLMYTLYATYDEITGDMVDNYKFELDYYGGVEIHREFSMHAYHNYNVCKYTIFWRLDDTDLDDCDYNIHDIMKTLLAAKKEDVLDEFVNEYLSIYKYGEKLVLFDADVDDNSRAPDLIDISRAFESTQDTWDL